MAYLPLSTANLPDPAIDPAQGSSPEDYFGVGLWVGNNSASNISVTGIGFQPDFFWGKLRSFGTGHRLVDSIRGVTKMLYSNVNNAEATESDAFASFDSDGFTIGQDTTGGGLNYSTNNGVGWVWKANGSATLNEEGSIDSQVSANTESGFSIVSYDGGSSAGTIGHGLSNAPDFIVIKNRDAGFSWTCYHESLGAGYYIQLNSTDAQTATTDWNNTQPTTNVFSVNGAEGRINRIDESFIAYCFHSVEGFSKFSSYVGNGDPDGTFVYTGFRPSFILYKCSSTTANWGMNDQARNPYNVVDEQLLPNSSGTTSVSNEVDYLSNGFKLRSSDGNSNSSGQTYIYMAFAENPFKYSNAR